MAGIARVVNLGWVTGEGSPNSTGSRFGVNGTDLGICWDNGEGAVLLAFGDTYGSGWGGRGAGPPGADWRWNTLAFSTSTHLDGGLVLDRFVPRGDGLAGQIISAERRLLRPAERTVIPTSGVALDGWNYLHYMSVARWGAPGGWRTNHGGIAYSDDGGSTWVRDRKARWRNDTDGAHPFQLVAFARSAGDPGHLYMLGTPNGRFGDIRLAKVPTADVLDPAAYTYFDGDGWVRDAFAANPVMRGPAGELSVLYHPALRRWVALHLDEHRAAIVLRTAERLTGPWNDGQVIVSGRDYPALYGGFLHPATARTSDPPALYFLLSQWGPYNVLLMRADLTSDR